MADVAQDTGVNLIDRSALQKKSQAVISLGPLRERVSCHIVRDLNWCPRSACEPHDFEEIRSLYGEAVAGSGRW
jgi:hypothetical protein